MPAEILLVHGSMLGAWCWEDTIAELTALGTEAAAFDLPGHGEDATPRGSVTVADYVAAVVERLDAAPEPVVLAGHSMAGYPIAAAALQRPDKVRHLVYFSAQARKPGQSWADTLDPAIRETYEREAAERGDGSYVVPAEVVASRWLSSLDPEDQRIEAIRSRLTPQPAGPLFEPWTLPAGALDGIPVTYIWPEEDRQNTERRMRMSLSNLPAATRLLTMGGDHCAMLTDPAGTAAALHAVVDG
ncbi:alpha/beta fold hydrolase [Arthrobacter sp. NPDC057259]|uniref:alpha/beta fold hydrolase n=1 Tax=Arthrobacter sp. NPDC057259 TaxID=3346073 RepID=UPI00362DBF66